MKKSVRRFICLLITTVMLFTSTAIIFAATADTTVYKTKTGNCYHLSTCSYLSKSKISTTLEKAINDGLKPCSRCKPPKTIEKEKKTVTTKEEKKQTTTVKQTTTTVVKTKTEKTVTVYKTKTGKCYHTSNCSSLSKSKISISLKDALNAKLTPCSKCKPPKQ